MPTPMLPRNSYQALRRTHEIGLDHTATRVRAGLTRLPRGQYGANPASDNPIDCHFQSIGAELRDLAASKGLAATGTLRVLLETEVPPGTVWDVSTGDRVTITGDLVRAGKTMRLVAVVTGELNKA